MSAKRIAFYIFTVPILLFCMLVGWEGIDQLGIEWTWLCFAAISPFLLGFMTRDFLIHIRK